MSAPRPYTLVAELTYACPLRCPYCSNPLDHAERPAGLDAAAWCRVLREAEDLGVVQVTLTGGEPLLRNDLEVIVAQARRLGVYSTLVTSGVPLQGGRLLRLRDAGLDAVQLSLQAADASTGDRLAGVPVHATKLAVAEAVRAAGLPLTLNVVLHRGNLEQVEALVGLAETLGAHRLELANVQLLGWALANRAALLPDADAIARARATVAAARARLTGRLEILFVTPDYHTGRPRACMGGWASRYLVVSPDGLVLPCQAAHTIPTLAFERAGARPLAEIWRDSPGLRAFRGEAWMPEPCRSCDERGRDLGGCRCQAFHLLGDAAATDPACDRSPHHGVVRAARAEALLPPAGLRPRRAGRPPARPAAP